MKNYDYNQIIKVLAQTAGKSQKIEYENDPNDQQRFRVSMSNDQGKPLLCSVLLKKYHIELLFFKDNIEINELKPLIKNFEYEMERFFLRNAKMELKEKGNEFQLDIEI